LRLRLLRCRLGLGLPRLWLWLRLGRALLLRLPLLLRLAFGRGLFLLSALRLLIGLGLRQDDRRRRRHPVHCASQLRQAQHQQGSASQQDTLVTLVCQSVQVAQESLQVAKAEYGGVRTWIMFQPLVWA